jgi:hypothetical protein
MRHKKVAVSVGGALSLTFGAVTVQAAPAHAAIDPYLWDVYETSPGLWVGRAGTASPFGTMSRLMFR